MQLNISTILHDLQTIMSIYVLYQIGRYVKQKIR